MIFSVEMELYPNRDVKTMTISRKYDSDFDRAVRDIELQGYSAFFAAELLESMTGFDAHEALVHYINNIKPIEDHNC